VEGIASGRTPSQKQNENYCPNMKMKRLLQFGTVLTVEKVLLRFGV
jgi:hypothetical protein